MQKGRAGYASDQREQCAYLPVYPVSFFHAPFPAVVYGHRLALHAPVKRSLLHQHQRKQCDLQVAVTARPQTSLRGSAPPGPLAAIQLVTFQLQPARKCLGPVYAQEWGAMPRYFPLGQQGAALLHRFEAAQTGLDRLRGQQASGEEDRARISPRYFFCEGDLQSTCSDAVPEETVQRRDGR